MNSAYCVDEILHQFDEGNRKHNFLALDGGKEIPADVRLTAYRDDLRWAVVFELLAFFPASPGHWGIVDMLYKFGNSIEGKIGFEHGDLVRVTSDGPDSPAFLPPIGLEVNPQIGSIKIRGNVVPVDLSPAALHAKQIPPPGELGLCGEHLLWSLLPEYRDLFLATDAEKLRRIPTDLPKFLQLEEWNHPRLMEERLKPSDSQTFQTLAGAIVSGDPSCYRPVQPPNTHWRNWLGCERI